MAFNKSKLTSDLKAIFNDPSITNNGDVVAELMADAFEAYVKSGNAVGADSRGDIHNLNLE